MIEVEVKLPIHDRIAVEMENALIEAGFVKSERYKETDVYFDNDEHQIRLGGEALRVRTVDRLNEQNEVVETEALITFKGKKMDQVSMTRQELETGVSDGMEALRIFDALGFHPVDPKVCKVRTHFSKGQMTACLDEVDGLGMFLELEVILDEDCAHEQALAKIGVMLRELGYTMEDTVRTSYLSMLMKMTQE